MSIDSKRVVGLVLHFRTSAQTLACVAAMIDEGIYSIVIVDNSQDGGYSLTTMRMELDRLRDLGVSFSVLPCERNLGFAKGVNVGLAKALECGADAVFLINSDAIIERGCLAALVSGVEKAGVALPRVRAGVGEPTRSLVGFYQCATGLLLHPDSPGCMPFPSGCCLLIREDIASPHLMDEDFFFYWEDVSLGQDLLARGVEVIECQDAVIIHAGSGSARNGSLFYEYHINRGHWLLAAKLARSSLQRFVYIALRSVTLPARASIRCLRFRSLTPWRGLFAATLDVIKGQCRDLTPPAT